MAGIRRTRTIDDSLTATWSFMARILSAVVLGTIAILVVIYAPPAIFLIGIGLTGTLCLYEYFGLIGSMGIKVQPWFSYGAFWILLIAFHQNRFPGNAIIALVLLAAFISTMWRYKQPIKERALALMAELLGILYLALFLFPALPIRYDFGSPVVGLQWVLVLLIVIWTNDTAALVAGKILGKNPLAPILSPKKTWEGAVAGLIAGTGVAAAIQPFLFRNLTVRSIIIASVLIGIAGQLGDLAESMLKRAAAVKDSSHIIPGHGGVLDRLDSLLFAIPVLYIYLLLIYK
jgi:phosphatidate cytidylyltransferase